MPPMSTYDVFISYAGKDGAPVAHPLQAELEAAGLNVWLDRGAMTAGDALGSAIDEGMDRSRYLVLVISPGYLEAGREWIEREIQYARRAQESRGTKLIIPVWHDVDKAAIERVDPWLAGLLAPVTSRKGARIDIAKVALAVLDVVAPERGQEVRELLRLAAEGWRQRLASITDRVGADNDPLTRSRALGELSDLADESMGDRRQECVDSLCQVVRTAGTTEADRTVQDAAMSIVRDHLSTDCEDARSWKDLHLDFTRATFASLNLSGIEVRGGLIEFHESTFEGDHFNFYALRVECPLPWQGVRFSGTHLLAGTVYFDRSEWLSGTVDFSGCRFGEGDLQFRGGTFNPGVGQRGGEDFPGINPPADLVVRLFDDGLSQSL